jgi:hypothetical protein
LCKKECKNLEKGVLDLSTHLVIELHNLKTLEIGAELPGAALRFGAGPSSCFNCWLTF